MGGRSIERSRDAAGCGRLTQSRNHGTRGLIAGSRQGRAHPPCAHWGGRFSALTSGSVAATILFPPFNFLALRDGYTSLGLSADYTKNFPFSTYSVNLNWAQNNKAAIRRFLAAYAKGVDWFYDRANRDEAISILISYLKSDPRDVADTYDYFLKLHAFDRVGAVEGSGIENYLTILKRDGDLEGGTDLGRFYDPNLVR